MDDLLERPLCKCHGEPMVKDWIRRVSHGKPCTPNQEFRCAVKKRIAAKKAYDELEGVAWSKRLLQMRRATAMHARREREARGETP